jgi:hypothetical protein
LQASFVCAYRARQQVPDSASVRFLPSARAKDDEAASCLRGLPAAGGTSVSLESIVIVVVIVLIVLFVLGYFGRGRFRR